MQPLYTDDGLPLHLRVWSVAGPARGAVLLVHGLGEHVGRYAHVAARLNAAGWHVAGYDQRGHGASGGARGRIPHAESLLRDLGLVIDRVRESGPQRLLLLGHSMGGLVVARYVAEGLAASPAAWCRPVDGLVMSSPALDAGMSWAQQALLGVLGPLAPGLAVGNGLKPEWVSRDPTVARAYLSDPLVHDRVTPRLVRFIVDAGLLVRARAAQWRNPTLLIYAGADRCVAPAGSDAFAAAAPAGIVKARRFPALYHEIFNEPEQAEVFAELEAWLAARV